MAPGALLIVLLALLAIPVGIVAIVYLIVPVFKGIGWFFRQIFRFVFGEIGDALRIIGAIFAQLFFLPLILGNVLIGRWSASAHYGRALSSEFKTLVACVYRMAIGHPARLLCLNAVVDGIEKRVPEAIAAAPGADKPSKSRAGQFEGYTIVGSLPGGGSGGKLYIATPDAIRLAGFTRAGQLDVRQVVIKTFSLKDGSSLPQIVRESRALEAAKRLGLVLDHELNDERFYYVMRYVPGESLGLVTQRLHAMSGGEGLTNGHLRQALGYSSDLLRTLDQYHRGGLWHKDVKPDNIIVDGSSAHLVDFGLVTPLRSGMTLTTHGTEYFRDPEMVRMALKGVKVHQVDGARFDVYAAGAVLFSMIENSFPAHGGLSQISKRCPEALRWVVRRAMTEYDKRYPSASAMMSDLNVVMAANDPFAVRPADLPSMRGAEVEAPAYDDEAPIRPQPVAMGVGSGSDAFGAPMPPPLPPFPPMASPAAGSPVPPGPRSRPKLKVNKWWTGGYVNEGEAEVRPAAFNPAPAAAAPVGGRRVRGTAREQLESAQSRARAARERAQARMANHRRTRSDFRVFNPGVVGALAMFCLVVVVAFALMFTVQRKNAPAAQVISTIPGVTFSTFSLPDIEPPSVPEAPAIEHTIVSKNAGVPTPRVMVNNKPRVEASAKVGPGRKVLVLSEVRPFNASMTTALDRLRESGFSVLGNIPGASESDVDRAEQETMEADIRTVRGLGQLDATDVSSRISGWMAEHDVNVVVWFVAGEDKGNVHGYVFMPSLENASGKEAAESAQDHAAAKAALMSAN